MREGLSYGRLPLEMLRPRCTRAAGRLDVSLNLSDAVHTSRWSRGLENGRFESQRLQASTVRGGR